MQKKRTKILMSKSNDLSIYLQDLYRDPFGTAFFAIQENSETQISQNSEQNFFSINFPEKTNLIAQFKLGHITYVDIEYNTQCKLDGIPQQQSPDLSCILKEGKFTFKDGSYILFSRDHLKLNYLRYFDRNQNLVKEYEGKQIQFVDQNFPNKVKIINDWFFIEGEMDNDGNLVKGVKYSSLGLYYSKFDFGNCNKNCEEFFEEYSQFLPSKISDLNFLDYEFVVSSIGLGFRVLSFKIQNIPGHFICKIKNQKIDENIFNSSNIICGNGIYRFQQFKQIIEFKIFNKLILFWIDLQMMNLNQLKTYLRSNITNQQKQDVNETFLFIQDDEIETQKSIEKKYVISYQNLVNKYEHLQKNFQDQKENSNEIIKQVVNENQSLNQTIQMLNETVNSNCLKMFDRKQELVSMHKECKRLNNFIKELQNTMKLQFKEIQEHERINIGLKKDFNQKEKEFFKLISNLQQKNPKMQQKKNNLGNLVDVDLFNLHIEDIEQNKNNDRNDFINIDRNSPKEKKKERFFNKIEKCKIVLLQKQIKLRDQQIQDFTKIIEENNLEIECQKESLNKQQLKQEQTEQQIKDLLIKQEQIVFNYKDQLDLQFNQKTQILKDQNKLNKKLKKIMKTNIKQAKEMDNLKLENNHYKKKIKEQNILIDYVQKDFRVIQKEKEKLKKQNSDLLKYFDSCQAENIQLKHNLADLEIIKQNNNELKAQLKKEQNKKMDLINKLNKIEAESFKFLQNFKGEVKKNKKEGYIEESNENYEFKGEYKNDQKFGEGIMKTDQFEYEGEFKNNKFCGKGKLLFKNENLLLEGQFDENGYFQSNSALHGKVQYTGDIEKNKLNGNGYYQFTNNLILEGVFKNNEIIEKIILIDLDSGLEKEIKKDNKIFQDRNSVKYSINYENGALQIIKEQLI